jgi:hypothetical protein
MTFGAPRKPLLGFRNEVQPLDHPRALALYRRMGFIPVRREAKTRKLTRAREM